jgi:hypothetical protein
MVAHNNPYFIRGKKQNKTYLFPGLRIQLVRSLGPRREGVKEVAEVWNRYAARADGMRISDRQLVQS